MRKTLLMLRSEEMEEGAPRYKRDEQKGIPIMKLTKTSLRKMILKEIRISIARSNLALEEDEELEEELGSGMTSYLDTEAANTTYTTSHGYKGDNMSTIAEGGGEHPDAEIFDEAIRLVEVLRDDNCR